MDSTAERPEFSALQYTLLLPIAFALVLTLTIRHKAPWRILAVAAYSSWTLYGLKSTAGDGYENFYTGCVLGINTLFALSIPIQPVPLDQWRHKADPRPLRELPFGKRLWYLICVIFESRGVDWTYQVSTISATNN